MKNAVYAGSFDPWSFGHQFVLDSSLQLFDVIHILVATNPAKRGILNPSERARVIAHSIDPFEDWWSQKLPCRVGKSVIVDATDGLVADYARSQKITKLIRGLRSTSDFEAEFNLYFANNAIDRRIQTWAIMCPPELLHCSSTYVRAVVGTPNVSFVGTTFTAQSLMLRKSRVVGEIFDLIQRCSINRFEAEPADLEASDLNGVMQLLFSEVIKKAPQNGNQTVSKLLHGFLRDRKADLRSQIDHSKYPKKEVAILWYLLFLVLFPRKGEVEMLKEISLLSKKAPPLGKNQIPLIDVTSVGEILQVIKKKGKTSSVKTLSDILGKIAIKPSSKKKVRK